MALIVVFWAVLPRDGSLWLRGALCSFYDAFKRDSPFGSVRGAALLFFTVVYLGFGFLSRCLRVRSKGDRVRPTASVLPV